MMLDINDIYENGKLFDGHYKLINLLITADGAADVWLAINGKYQFRSEFKKVFSCHDEDIIQPTDFNIHEVMPYWVLPYCHRGAFAYMYPERFSARSIVDTVLKKRYGRCMKNIDCRHKSL